MNEDNRSILHGLTERVQALAPALLCACLLTLGGCQTTGPADTADPERRADSLANAGRHQDAARIYIALAGESRGAERSRLTLLAVSHWLAAGDTVRARSAFESIDEPLEPALRTDWIIVAARLDLEAGDPRHALQRLRPLDSAVLSQEQRVALDGLRGEALFDTGAPREALGVLTRREMWLDDAQAVAANHRIIWSGLIDSDLEDLQTAVSAADDPVVAGWLALGILGVTAAADDSMALRAGIANWRRTYPGHPAMADLVPELLGTDFRMVDYPRQIGVLLPLSGRSGSAAAALRDGLMGAYYNDFREGLKPLVRLYDIGAGGSAAAYQVALDEGAEFIIGPLLKTSVVEVATVADVRVPTLALNMLPDEVVAPPSFYQFALAPEDEAAQVAERAIIDERARALALVPRSQWGERVLNAFATSLQANGGRLLDYRQYDAGAADFSDTIESLLLLDESVGRYRRMRSLVGQPLQFEPRRRQDIDFIFLAADGETARLLRPQLKFHYAGGIPVYATSAVNERDGRSDSDLNGILFPEVPWIVSERTDVEGIRQLYAALWRDSDRLARLYAMGYDAYTLVGELHSPDGAFSEPVAGLTGELFMDSRGRIHRRLPFATFRRGEVVAVPGPEPEGELPAEPETDEPEDFIIRGAGTASDERAWGGPDGSD